MFAVTMALLVRDQLNAVRCGTASARTSGRIKLTSLLEENIKRSFDLPETSHLAIVERYMRLTKIIMPTLAQNTKRHWPVRNDHCFQRIVLDTICGGVWYDHIARPAYRHLNADQAAKAVQLCEQIIAEKTDLHVLNQQSLAWRGKSRKAGYV